MHLLALQALTVGRGRRTLVEGLTLTVSSGEAVHLTGPNGSGKSTVLETAAGLRQPWEGRVQRPVALHWLGHRNGLAGTLTARENLEAWAGLQADIGLGVNEALAAWGVPLRGRRLCRQLSAGQRRRTALARLLMARRTLWILDEPLDGLDAEGLERFQRIAAEHLKAGGGMLITSHQPLPAALPGVRLEALARA